MAIVETPQTNYYGVIHADPPWLFRTWSDQGKGRSAERHYDCMTFEDIKSLPVSSWASEDCVLFLWVTDPMLERAFEVIKAWGFTYKTVGFYWIKKNKSGEGWFSGLGYWTRANPEQCLLATRGSPKRKAADVSRLIISNRREHSRKPDEVFDSIERLCDGPYLDIFSRNNRLRWHCWGNEAGVFDEGD